MGECKDEESRLEKLTIVANNLVRAFPSVLAIEAGKMAKTATQNRNRVQDIRESLEEKDASEREQRDSRKPSAKTSAKPSREVHESNPLDDAVDIDDLFSDL